jgi:hypothetical protein
MERINNKVYVNGKPPNQCSSTELIMVLIDNNHRIQNNLDTRLFDDAEMINKDSLLLLKQLKQKIHAYVGPITISAPVAPVTPITPVAPVVPVVPTPLSHYRSVPSDPNRYANNSYIQINKFLK